MVYAFLDEFHQSFIPFRSASVTDLIKDMTGIAWYGLQSNRPITDKTIQR
ncbi:hypothetical protein P378_01310 [Desulforamulus profundi]|uniref:Mobile element protein n=1 Tax=Desulforamulus profundi TaxID=1383067 RepID=A0A2C6LMM0_9FIRM|nr:VanZ family protein [Desulforamulus profundi]PHJ39850.1 hypothetical protein P378_01310 [Desulforamulus profundi]